MKKYLFLLSLLILCIFTFSCSKESEDVALTDSQIYTVQKGTIANEITATGNLSMPHYAKLSFGSSGTVEEVNVILGDEVEEGQILAMLDESTQSSLQQALLKAQVNQKQAQMNLEDASTPTLSSSGSTVSAPDPLDIESKEIALEQAKLAVEDAQRQMDKAVLIAPFDGLIAEINITPEENVSSGTTAIRIIDPTQLEVDTQVNETDIYNIELGMDATIEVTALSPLTIAATVFAISPAASVSSGVVSYTIQLRAEAPQENTGNPYSAGNNQTAFNNSDFQPGSGQMPADMPADMPMNMPTDMPTDMPSEMTMNQTMTVPTLKEGLSVNVTIILDERKDIILVPVRAIMSEGRTSYVNVMKDDGTIEKRTVTTGINDWQNIEVTDGLIEGEKIVISQSASSTSTNNNNSSQQQGPPGGGMMMIR
jgi:membrane fusion protein, macrolide-specific efflux system